MGNSTNNKQEQKKVKFQTTFEISNIGPHLNLNQTINSNSLRYGIYANNGEGKTFLSRLLRLLSKTDLKPEDSNYLLTLTKESGYCKFIIEDKRNEAEVKTRELRIDIKQGIVPVINNKTGYIFHTFNSDYVKENIETQNYKLNGNIDGYIIGKERIDLTAEKAKHEQYLTDLNNLTKNIEKSLAKAQVEASQYVSKNLSEYSYLNINNLLNFEFQIEEKNSFKEYVRQFEQLKSMPLNLPDISEIQMNIDSKVLDEISEFLSIKYSKSTLAEDFVKKIKSKHEFIESGISLVKVSNLENCPFCEQELGEMAKSLIIKYEEYLSDNEAIVAKHAKKLEVNLNILYRSILEIITKWNSINTRFNEYRNYIPDFKNKLLEPILTSTELEDSFSKLSKLIREKKENIALVISTDEYETLVGVIKKWLYDLSGFIISNNATIRELNTLKNHIDGVRINLTREICKARFIELKIEANDIIKEFQKIKAEKEALSQEILVRESKIRVDKKVRVTEVFTKLLRDFFGDEKYTLDEDSYCLKLQNHLLEKNASAVLSDGEKGIIAFCYYLAESFKYVESEADIANLFFIIDDPISSLDFHYVYVVSQILRNINSIFNIERSRYIVLTHNIEFMSILIRNNIVSDKWVLSKGKFEELKNKLIMPYEAHLRDIYKIAKGDKIADHTTPNSIIHVLETINQFESPDMEFNVFCNKLDGFEKNAFIYTLIHDNSHGTIRTDKPYTDEMLKNGCVFVIDFLEKKFKGQINFIIANN